MLAGSRNGSWNARCANCSRLLIEVGQGVFGGFPRTATGFSVYCSPECRDDARLKRLAEALSQTEVQE